MSPLGFKNQNLFTLQTTLNLILLEIFQGVDMGLFRHMFRGTKSVYYIKNDTLIINIYIYKYDIIYCRYGYKVRKYFFSPSARATMSMAANFMQEYKDMPVACKWAQQLHAFDWQCLLHTCLQNTQNLGMLDSGTNLWLFQTPGYRANPWKGGKENNACLCIRVS